MENNRRKGFQHNNRNHRIGIQIENYNNPNPDEDNIDRKDNIDSKDNIDDYAKK
jgi:hypothetical protein